MKIKRRFVWRAVPLLMLWLPAAVSAQQADGQEDARLTQPSEYGIRFTPGMARSIAKEVVKHNFRRRYELPEEKETEAVDMVTRRLMEMAHKLDGPGQELVERFVEEQFKTMATDGHQGFMPQGFGKEFADRLLPMMPAIRDLTRNVSQDIRPMLPMKQQLKMAGELMAVKTAMDGFEDTMKKWSSGEVTVYDDPFNPRRREVKRDETGQSKELQGAYKNAEAELERVPAREWENYLKQFKEFYQLDAGQAATADSIFREFTERAQRLTSDPGWRARFYRNVMWRQFLWNLPNAWNHPVRALIEDQQEELLDPLNKLGVDFRTRLDTIPTDMQRRTAQQAVEADLQEKGFDIP